MYLRFVVPDIDEDSGMELGVFHAVRNLREEGKLYRYEEERHDLIRQWFNENLEKPTRFTASKPPFYRKPNKAQCKRTPQLRQRTDSDSPKSWGYCSAVENRPRWLCGL
jgi:hypothetical protein